MVLSIVLGFVGILLGLLSWIGWLPVKPRTSYFSGGTHVELAIMGFGLVILGVVGPSHERVLGAIGLAIVIAGFVAGVLQPSWIAPRWYKERYPDPPVQKEGGSG